MQRFAFLALLLLPALTLSQETTASKPFRGFGYILTDDQGNPVKGIKPGPWTVSGTKTWVDAQGRKQAKRIVRRGTGPVGDHPDIGIYTSPRHVQRVRSSLGDVRQRIRDMKAGKKPKSGTVIRTTQLGAPRKSFRERMRFGVTDATRARMKARLEKRVQEAGKKRSPPRRQTVRRKTRRRAVSRPKAVGAQPARRIVHGLRSY